MASRTAVDVSRVYTERGDTYARINTIGTTGVRPFVLVPGIGVSSTYFERLAPNLNEFGPVHALDLPGFGGVPHPDSAMTIRQYADLVGRVIDDLELDDPIIVGHSMGTQIVSDLVSRRPEISTVVLIGPVVNPRERWVARQALRFLQAAWHEPFKVKFLAVSAYLVCGFKWFSRVLPEMMQYPIEKALPNIRAHTLVIRGEFDAVAPREWVEEVGRLLPLSRLWEMPGAAHSVMHAHAEEVALLCVEHAEQATSDSAPGDDDELQHYDTSADDIPDTLPPVSIPDAVAAVKGRITEAVGVARGDDDLIAEGKTEHAQAMERSGDASRVDAAERERAGQKARAEAERRGEQGATAER
ncbi:alpha/beta fold hydrolase [Subtercola boreus]|nr:alpha/beta fold hydrolase [Subtercola boreus]